MFHLATACRIRTLLSFSSFLMSCCCSVLYFKHWKMTERMFIIHGKARCSCSRKEEEEARICPCLNFCRVNIKGEAGVLRGRKLGGKNYNYVNFCHLITAKNTFKNRNPNWEKVQVLTPVTTHHPSPPIQGKV